MLCLTINRYKIINGQPEYPICTTYSWIVVIWAQSIILASIWYLISPGAPWHYLLKNDTIPGIFLENVMILINVLPVPLVLILMLLTAFKARQHLSTMVSDEGTLLDAASQQIENDLKLLHAFGIVYILGFGFMFVDGVNQLINLSGELNVVPYWQRDKTFCVYQFFIEQVCNMAINFANSVIIVRSRHVRVALRKMYQATTRAARNMTRGENLERLIPDED